MNNIIDGREHTHSRDLFDTKSPSESRVLMSEPISVSRVGEFGTILSTTSRGNYLASPPAVAHLGFYLVGGGEAIRVFVRE